jgi:hypothetical protein
MKVEEFLLARITEDEKVAEEMLRNRRPHSGELRDHLDENGVSDAEVMFPFHRRRRVLHNDQDWFVAVAPERVIAECAAKRRIIEHVGEIEFNSGDAGTHEMGEEILLHLALPYAKHPEYREEWEL